MTSQAAEKPGAAEILGSSPDGSITIQRSHAGETGQHVEFLDAKTGNLLFAYPGTWSSTNLVWEKSGAFLCINEETPTSGDFIHIFKITGGRIALLRAPGAGDFSSALRVMLAAMPSPGRFTFTGEKWTDKNHLLAVVSGGHYGDSYFETLLQIDDDGRIEIIKPKPAPQR